MSDARANKINDAINACLDQIFGKPNRTRAIGAFLARLRNDKQWLDWEVMEVEEAVRHSAELLVR